jgi:hypothetical protein
LQCAKQVAHLRLSYCNAISCCNISDGVSLKSQGGCTPAPMRRLRRSEPQATTTASSSRYSRVVRRAAWTVVAARPSLRACEAATSTSRILQNAFHNWGFCESQRRSRAGMNPRIAGYIASNFLSRRLNAPDNGMQCTHNENCECSLLLLGAKRHLSRHSDQDCRSSASRADHGLPE